MPTEQFALDNATIWPGDGSSLQGHVVVEGDAIAAVAPGPAPAGMVRHDMQGQALSPGLIDLMMLGGFGKSILRDDPVAIAREYVHLGVTACQLCVCSLAWDDTVAVIRNAERAVAESRAAGRDNPCAEILGLYLEGPFMQPDLTGASLREHAQPPSPANVRRVLSEAGKVLTMINVAPGTPGAPEAVAAFREAGKIVSMAHSNAPAEEVEKCLAAGTTILGHIWDNNAGLIGDSGVQQPTIEQVALTDERIRFIHLIGDGVHVHPVMVRLVLRCRGIESLCLVTDAVPRAGCDDGPYVWDDGRVFSKAGGVGRTDTGGLTGSALLLPDMLRNLMKFSGLPPEQAIRSVTLNPAASLGLEHRIGALRPGLRADIVAWDRQMKVRRVWRAGRELDRVAEIGEVSL